MLSALLAPRPTTVPLPPVDVAWYRTPLAPEVKRRLHELSDLKAAVQTLGFLAQLALWGALAVHFAHLSARPRPLAALFFSLLYGAQANFLINGMHELGHGQVFRTAWLNHFFCRIVSFLGWLHPDLFFSSHLRHHRFTQHNAPARLSSGVTVPLDLENPMPVRISAWDFLGFGFINMRGFVDIVLRQTVAAALGVFPTGHLGWRRDWELYLYPADDATRARADRFAPVLWARVMLVGHAAIAWAALERGLWLVPVLVSLGPFYNGWLFFLCNSTQHVGLQPDRADFRLNTRTFYRMYNGTKRKPAQNNTHPAFKRNPLPQPYARHSAQPARATLVLGKYQLQQKAAHRPQHHPLTLALYPAFIATCVLLLLPAQHMNWHTEHHMYAAVPCYNLAELHEAIKHDLPPTPDGLVAVWTRM